MALKRILRTAVRHPLATTATVVGVAKGTISVVQRLVRGNDPWTSTDQVTPAPTEAPTDAQTEAQTEREPGGGGEQGRGGQHTVDGRKSFCHGPAQDSDAALASLFMDLDLSQLRALDATVRGGTLEAAARALHVHSNTLRHRLRRFEEATGATLRDPRDLVELWWALERRRLAGD